MEPLQSHDTNASSERLNVQKDTRTIAVSFAGYDRERGGDDLVYVAVNSHWEDVTINLPDLHRTGSWYLSVNTYGDGQGRYCYKEHEEVRIDGSFIMRPRSVAVFTGRSN